MTGDSDLAAGEGLFTGEARAGEGPGPEPLAGTTVEAEEAEGSSRGQGWAGSMGGLGGAAVCGWDGSGGACICAFAGTGTWRAAGSCPGGGAGAGAFGGCVFTGTGSGVCGSAVCGCGGNCSAGGRGAAGRPAGGSLAGSCGGGVCRLAAFCTGGPVEGSYRCWLCFWPAS